MVSIDLLQEMSLQALFRTDGLFAVVTGGGSGLGRYIARALSLNGAAKVYILGRRQTSLDACAASVSTKNIIPIQCDVTSAESVSAALSQISRETEGKINLLVCNAGVEGPTAHVYPQRGASVAEFAKSQAAITLDQHAECFRTNVGSVWNLIISFLELLDAGNKAGNVGWSSQVINLTSVAGYSRVSPGAFTYAQSKAAVTHLTKQLASTLVTYNIRANAIAPGMYPTEMTNHWVDKGVVLPEEYPGGRFGDELDMAGAILFLASRAGGFVNGQILISDGGKLGTIPATY